MVCCQHIPSYRVQTSVSQRSEWSAVSTFHHTVYRPVCPREVSGLLSAHSVIPCTDQCVPEKMGVVCCQHIPSYRVQTSVSQRRWESPQGDRHRQGVTARLPTAHSSLQCQEHYSQADRDPDVLLSPDCHVSSRKPMLHAGHTARCLPLVTGLHGHHYTHLF